MAVAYETSPTPAFVSFLAAGEAETVSVNAGTGENRVLIVAVIWTDQGNNLTGVTYAGAAMTEVAAKFTENGRSIHLWRKVAPASGANNLVVTMGASGGGDSLATIAAWVGNGVDQTTPIDGLQTDTDLGTTAAAVSQAPAVTSAVGDRVVTFHYFRHDSQTCSATPTAFTERQDANDGGALATVVGDADGAASVTPIATWSNTGSDGWTWAAASLNVNAAGGAGPSDLSVSLGEPVIGGSLF